MAVLPQYECDVYVTAMHGHRDPPLIETGDKLEDMTSELRPSESISEFVSSGPNNYAYSVLTGQVRGIKLNYNASKMVIFFFIRDMISRVNKGNEPSVVNVDAEKKIKRKRKAERAAVSIVTEPED